jgi:hypothetical protein
MSSKPPKRVLLNEVSYERDGRYHWHGQWFTGWAVSEDPRANEEQEFRQGLRWGPARVFNPRGTLIIESSFRRDVFHGPSREWSDDGRLTREARYEHGMLVEERRWNETGALISDVKIDPSDPRLAELRLRYGTPEQVEEEERDYQQRSGERAMG